MKPANQNPARVALSRAVNDSIARGNPVFEEIAPAPEVVDANAFLESVGMTKEEFDRPIKESIHKARLEYLRGQLNAESISYGELQELQSLVEYIAPDDVQLLEAAGVPEHDESPVVGAVTTIDLTPTWAETAQMVARLFINGTTTGQSAALDTLKQMGAICDAYKELATRDKVPSETAAAAIEGATRGELEAFAFAVLAHGQDVQEAMGDNLTGE